MKTLSQPHSSYSLEVFPLFSNGNWPKVEYGQGEGRDKRKQEAIRVASKWAQLAKWFEVSQSEYIDIITNKQWSY